MTIGPLAHFVTRSAGWVRPYRLQATLIALGLFLEAAFTAAVPLAFQQLIDRAIVPRDTQLLTTLLALLIVGVVIVAAAGLGRDYLYARLCSKVLRDLRIDMLDHVHRLSPSNGSNDDDAAIAAYFSTDLATYYLDRSGAVYLVGSIDTDGAVWEPCESLPDDAEPSDFAPELAEEAEHSRLARGID